MILGKQIILVKHAILFCLNAPPPKIEVIKLAHTGRKNNRNKTKEKKFVKALKVAREKIIFS